MSQLWWYLMPSHCCVEGGAQIVTEERNRNARLAQELETQTMLLTKTDRAARALEDKLAAAETDVGHARSQETALRYCRVVVHQPSLSCHPALTAMLFPVLVLSSPPPACL